MRTLAEALAEQEFYARSMTGAPVLAERNPKQRAAVFKMALLSGFTPKQVGTGPMLNKQASATA